MALLPTILVIDDEPVLRKRVEAKREKLREVDFMGYARGGYGNIA